MPGENNKQFSFDDVVVDCEDFRVQKAGEVIALTPRAFDVLVVLMSHPGRLVEKSELFDRVWKDTHVTDNALTKVVKEIRHALSDDANAPQYIETVPKHGYRFIGRLNSGHNQQQIRASVALTKSRIFSSVTTLALLSISISVFAGLLLFSQKPVDRQIRSIAVLPLKPLNLDSRDESLEVGMAETLITRLSNLQQVLVRPLGAVRKYTDPQQDPVKAGHELKADAVLDGSIQKVDGRIRVTMRLIDVRDGKAVWSEQFDENFTDIFKVQDSITQRIATALTLQLTRQEKEQLAKHLTENPEAYQLYLRAQLIWNGRRQNWIEQSLDHYQQALQKDPQFALAHIGAADCYIMMSGHRRISMPEAESKARPHIMAALKIDDSLAQAHNALAELKYQYEYDWNGAETEFKKAIELNPNVAWIRQAYGWFLMSTERFDEAKIEMEKARELDPSSLTINVGRARLFYYMRQYDQAIQHFQNIISVEPDDSSAYFSLYTIYEQKRMYPEAVEAFLKCMSLRGAPTKQIDKYREAFRVSGWQGFLNQQLQTLQLAEKTYKVEPYQFANLYVRLGKTDEAFTWLERTFAARDAAILQFKIEPMYDGLRHDPRYARLVRKIGS